MVWLGLVRLRVLVTGLTVPRIWSHTRDMRGSRLPAWLGIGLLVGLMLAPTTALAGRSHGGRGGGGRGHGGHHGGRPHGVGHHHHHKGHHHNGLINTTDGFRNTTNGFHNGFHHKGHRFGHGFVSSCCAGVVYGPPAYYYPPAISYGVDYAPPPVYPVSYQAAPVYTAAPMVGTGSVTITPAPPSVVEYPPYGRYELRGDGVTTAYTWVWIPNPPPAPPPAAPAPPAAPPAVAPPTAPPPASDTPRPRLYRWTDDLGVTHWTNRGDAVPPEYRKLAAPAAP
jgi:hypothetical protein